VIPEKYVYLRGISLAQMENSGKKQREKRKGRNKEC
jgi:hypothetical protein